MQVLNFPSRKLNKKKMIIFVSICAIAFILLITGIIYAFNSSFRAFIDIHIFRKQIKSDNLTTIDINSDEDQFFHAYDKYITLLKKNTLYSYTSSGQVVSENDVNISHPIFASNNNFLAIAESNGNNLYLISGSNILWQKTLEGNISKVDINKNGYMSVILSGTSYKSIIITFDKKGNELFKTYISENMTIDTDISNDNKYLSIAEIDYSGSIIKSMIKTISIEKAKDDPTNSVIYTYSENNNLITNIEYQDRNTLICMYNNSIHLIDISNLSNNELFTLNTNHEFVDINLKNNFIYTENKNVNFSNFSIINILNVYNNSINKYEFKGSIKSIFAYNEKIAINTGSEIYFIGLNGWLIKKYASYNEINNVILGDTVAGIIYKDRIEIIEI